MAVDFHIMTLALYFEPDVYWFSGHLNSSLRSPGSMDSLNLHMTRCEGDGHALIIDTRSSKIAKIQLLIEAISETFRLS